MNSPVDTIVLCPECRYLDKPSRVFYHGETSTLMEYTAYWDEEGTYHEHDPNIHTRFYKCSNGHMWTQKHKNLCPQYDFGGIIG